MLIIRNPLTYFTVRISKNPLVWKLQRGVIDFGRSTSFCYFGRVFWQMDLRSLYRFTYISSNVCKSLVYNGIIGKTKINKWPLMLNGFPYFGCEVIEKGWSDAEMYSFVEDANYWLSRDEHRVYWHMMIEFGSSYFGGKLKYSRASSNLSALLPAFFSVLHMRCNLNFVVQHTCLTHKYFHCFHQWILKGEVKSSQFFLYENKQRTSSVSIHGQETNFPISRSSHLCFANIKIISQVIRRTE